MSERDGSVNIASVVVDVRDARLVGGRKATVRGDASEVKPLYLGDFFFLTAISGLERAGIHDSGIGFVTD